MDLASEFDICRDLPCPILLQSLTTSLSPHRPYDFAIDLLPGMTPPRGWLYSLSLPEQEAMQKYISEAFDAGLIQPSSSPAGAGFFFVGKTDRGLHPCIDFRGLNNITIKHKEQISPALDLIRF